MVLSQAGGVREYGIADALIPLPLLCMRPILAVLSKCARGDVSRWLLLVEIQNRVRAKKCADAGPPSLPSLSQSPRFFAKTSLTLVTTFLRAPAEKKFMEAPMSMYRVELLGRTIMAYQGKQLECSGSFS